MIRILAMSTILFLGLNMSVLTFANASVKCKYSSGDIGSIIGHGSTHEEAYADAAEKCFDQRVAMYTASRGSLTEDRGLDFIDSCINIQCEN